MTEVGGDDSNENVVDRVGMGTNENAAWVNAPGMFFLFARNLLWPCSGGWSVLETSSQRTGNEVV